MADLRAWLDDVGLPQYAESFDRNAITEALLPTLTDADLKEIGIGPLGHRKQLLAAIASLQGAPTAVAHQAQPLRTPAPAERRQLTVLFCDLSGSTQLSQQLDPESLSTLMEAYQRACRAVVERYEGYVAQYLGDGIMAYFGWPKAHEDDAERALRAALELVAAVRGVSAPAPLHVRIGVASGPVVVGEGGDDPSSPKLAVGETPNIAARLQALAGLDEIVIAPSTRQLAGGAFHYSDLGAQTLKGILEPVHAWRVQGVSEAQGRFEARTGHLTPLVGRQDEVELLKKRWSQVQSGEGQVVLLSGEPGIGKSRLTQVLSEHVASAAHYRLRYQCSPYHVNSAFYPIVEHLTRAAKLSPEDTPQAKLQKLDASLAQAESIYPHSTQLIAALLGIPTDYPALNYTPQKHKDETMKALAAQVTGLAAQAPVLLILEDAHWIDPSSLEAFEQLIQAIASQSVLLLVTYRPEFQPEWVGQSNVSALTLNRLTKKQTADLARRVASEHALPEPVIEQISTKTDGIPLFVEELTKVILERGPKPGLDIPATLKDSLMARLDRLGPVKEIAQIGACIGREFEYRLLALVAPGGARQLKDALQQLVEAELLFQRGAPPEASYSFKHALIQDAAYDSLLRTRRVPIHGQIAQSIEKSFPEVKENEPELLARHLSGAEQYDQAISWWCRAGELAVRRLALSEAIGHFERGLALVQQVADRQLQAGLELDLRAGAGIAWMLSSGWAHSQVVEQFQRAWELAQQLRRVDHTLRVLWGLWVHRLCIGEVETSLLWAERLLQEGEAAQRTDLLIAGHWAAALGTMYNGQFERAVEHCRWIDGNYDPVVGRAILDLLGYDPKSLAGVHNAWCQFFLGYPQRALRMVDGVLAHARVIDHPNDLAYALWIAGTLYGMLRDPAGLNAALDEVAALGREHSLPFYDQVSVPIARCWVSLLSGDLKPVDEVFENAVSVWKSVGLQIGLPLHTVHYAEMLALAGALDKALAIVEEALTQTQRDGWGERYCLAETLRVKGLALELKGESEAAETAYRTAIEVARAQHAKSLELRSALHFGRLLKSRGRSHEARGLLQPVYDWFTEGFDTKDMVEAKALLRELE